MAVLRVFQETLISRLWKLEPSLHAHALSIKSTRSPSIDVGLPSYTVRQGPRSQGREAPMKRRKAKRMLLAAATAAMLVQPLRAEVFERTKQVGDTAVHYKIVLPDGYAATKT